MIPRRRWWWPVAGALVATLAVALAAPGAHAGELDDLVDRADNVFRSKTAAGVLEMEVKTSSFTRNYKVVSWDDRRGKGRVLVKILGPAMWRGYGTLKIGNQLKLYNPRTNHVAVVSSSMLGDSWMGSHFTNDDLVRETELARDYTLELARKWQGDSPLGTKATFYRIRMTPKPTAPVAWGRIDYELFDDGKNILPLSARYFRKPKDTRASRTMTFSRFAALGGRVIPAEVKVTVADKPGEYTRIAYDTIKYDVEIPSSKFTEQALRK